MKVFGIFLITFLSFNCSESWGLSYNLVGVGNVHQQEITQAGVGAKSDGNVGYGGGLLLGIPLGSGLFNFEVGAMTYKREYALAQTTYSYTTIVIPAGFRLRFGKLSLGAGAYYGKHGDNLTKTPKGGSSETITMLSEKIKTTELGTTFYGGWEIPFGSVALTLEGRLNQSSGEMSDLEGKTLKNTDVQGLVGLRFGGKASAAGGGGGKR